MPWDKRLGSEALKFRRIFLVRALDEDAMGHCGAAFFEKLTPSRYHLSYAVRMVELAPVHRKHSP